MLKKTARLTTEAFNQYFKTGRRFHADTLQVIWCPAPSFHGAVVVGKKVYKRAVDRNRLRRRLYGVLYTHMRSQTLTGVYIVIVKPTAATLPYSLLKADLLSLIGRITQKQVQ